MVAQQLARFGSQCRLFAPMYRQVTLAALRTRLTGGDAGARPRPRLRRRPRRLEPLPGARQRRARRRADRPLAGRERAHRSSSPARSTAPVQPAARLGDADRHQRGGAEGQGRRRRVQARAAVPRRAARLAASSPTRRSARPCRRRPTTLFGRVRGAGMEAGCTNPAALAGGSGALHAYLTGVGSLDRAGRRAGASLDVEGDASTRRLSPCPGCSPPAAPRTSTPTTSRSPSIPIPPTLAPTTSRATSARRATRRRSGACIWST